MLSIMLPAFAIKRILQILFQGNHSLLEKNKTKEKKTNKQKNTLQEQNKIALRFMDLEARRDSWIT